MSQADERAHTNRSRAESFGALAGQYDRTRPGYPDELVAALLEGGPRTALDVGCGTGKGSAPLVARGVEVLGVEIDERMADVARGHGVPVEVAAFEDWDPRGRSFDLVLCAQAWHWIDPVRGAEKVARVLRPAGRVALFWNIGGLAKPVQERMDAVYAEVVPGMPRSVLHRGVYGTGIDADALRAAGLTAHRTAGYPWRQRYTRAAWLDMLATHSDHATLPPGDLRRLRERAGQVVDELGGSVEIEYETRLLLASR